MGSYPYMAWYWKVMVAGRGRVNHAPVDGPTSMFISVVISELWVMYLKRE